ncbi:MAG: DUF3854 domain-containing protein, partial [Methanotrichaceae archaeon]|nr:DUF3854 domain-containing protein [Methanotrichaceae archaeon]
MLIKYPGNGCFTIRLDEPIIVDGKPLRYIKERGASNALYNPGIDTAQSPQIWITEGELKAMCAYDHGLPFLGISGVWCWKITDDDGESLPDDQGLLPELAKINWTDKEVVLLYDSDII